MIQEDCSPYPGPILPCLLLKRYELVLYRIQGTYGQLSSYCSIFPVSVSEITSKSRICVTPSTEQPSGCTSCGFCSSYCSYSDDTPRSRCWISFTRESCLVRLF